MNPTPDYLHFSSKISTQGFCDVQEESGLQTIAMISADIEAVKADAAQDINEIIAQWEGMKLHDLETKQRFCAFMMCIAERIDRLFECPRCGRGARIRASRTLKEENGQFQFAHTKGHRTTHQAGAEIPLLKLVQTH
ncbi:MAG: hypothetical protein WCX29_03785 [Candidatus Peribacteraceae bacterium]|jgi:hypothetical protein